MSSTQARTKLLRNKNWLFLLSGVSVVSAVLTALLSSAPPEEQEKLRPSVSGRQQEAITLAAGEPRPRLPLQAQREDPLRAEKEVFYREHNLERDLPGRAVAWKPVDPQFKFWVHQLQSRDPQRKQAAFKIFQQASAGGYAGGDVEALAIDYAAAHEQDGPTDADVRGIRQTMLYLEKFESSRIRLPDTAYDWTALTDAPELNRVLKEFIPLLGVPESSDMALQVLNFFSLDIYAEKDAHWWQTNYSGSKLHAMLSGRPSTEWLGLPE